MMLHLMSVIRTFFREQKGTRIQAALAQGAEGTVEVDPSYEPGLADLDGFSPITLVCLLHLCDGFDLRVTPYLNSVQRGIFAKRAPGGSTRPASAPCDHSQYGCDTVARTLDARADGRFESGCG